jgi:hypothetical protein
MIGCSQLKGVAPNIREHKLRTFVNWQETLKQEDVKETGMKRELGVS